MDNENPANKQQANMNPPLRLISRLRKCKHQCHTFSKISRYNARFQFSTLIGLSHQPLSDYFVLSDHLNHRATSGQDVLYYPICFPPVRIFKHDISQYDYEKSLIFYKEDCKHTLHYIQLQSSKNNCSQKK